MAVLDSQVLDNDLDTVAPSADDSALARESGRRLATLLGGSGAVLVQIGESHETLALPASALRLLARLLEEMGEGHAVALLAIQAELSTQQAAALLNVSRPYVVRLLDEGKLPSRKVGTHRRVQLRDVLDFKRRDDVQRLKAMEELQALSQEMGLY